jgi:hypothetical protein
MSDAMTMTRETRASAPLLSAAAVRERCGLIERWVADGKSAHFTLDESRLPAVADAVSKITRETYPDLKVPPHSRWRHFSVGYIDRWALLSIMVGGETEADRARAAIDLAFVSVLLDAGAGDKWRYQEAATGKTFARSEGLAVASIDMFRAGAFSSDSDKPLRVDAKGLEAIDADILARHFQVTADNPLTGLEGRANLLRRLGRALAKNPSFFGAPVARPGHLVDWLLSRPGARIEAAELQATLLGALSPIWPSGLVHDCTPLGDAAHHPAIRPVHADGIVPFHKLSQWLTYSLIEPLEWAGIAVERLDGLTALAEYRNGGLLVDLGVIRPRKPLDLNEKHAVTSELIVEWRALTIVLMDRLLDPVRQRLGLGPSFALPHMLQGGTWAAGRKVAQEKRPPNGPPPIAVAADGTVF